MEKIKEVFYKDHSLLCNFENGAVVYVEEENRDAVRDYIQTGDQKGSAYPILEQIGFFQPKDIRKQVYLHVTHRCNMDCVGCYSRISNRNQKKDLSFEELIKILKQLKKRGYTNLVLSGGEPMLRKDIAEIIDEAKKRDFNTVMITNDSIEIEEDVFKNLDALAISIDEIEKEENPLGRKIHKEKILKILKAADKEGTEISGIVTLNRTNIDRVEQYHELSQEYNLPITYSLFYSKDKDSKEFLVTEKQLVRFTNRSFQEFPYTLEGFSPQEEIYCKENCGAGEKSISVDAEGNLSPCHMMHNIKLGNILEDSESSWEKLKEFKDKLDTEINECRECNKSAFCGRGCLARSMAAGGTYKKDPYCSLYDTYYELQFDLLFR